MPKTALGHSAGANAIWRDTIVVIAGYADHTTPDGIVEQYDFTLQRPHWTRLDRYPFRVTSPAAISFNDKIWVNSAKCGRIIS